MGILIHYESNNLKIPGLPDQSFKRSSQNKQKLLKPEVVILKTVTFRPDKNSLLKNKILWERIAPSIKALEKGKYEIQLLKYFDFTGWITNQFKMKIET